MDPRQPVPPYPEPSSSPLTQAHMLGQLWDGASCLVALKDLNHRYLYANRELEALYGVAPGGLVGSVLEGRVSFKHMTEMHAREDSVIKQGAATHFFERLVIRGIPHTWETIRFPFRDPAGKITGSGLVAIDVDESAPLTDVQHELLQRANNHITPHTPAASLPTSTASSILQIQWRTIYECGNPTIDRQHRSLFEQANHLLNAVLTDAPIAASKQQMSQLMQDIMQHFHDEESILRQAAYPHTDAHHQIHAQLLTKANALTKQFEDNQIILEDLFRFLAQDVISHHLLGEDRDFFAFIDRNFVIDP